MDVRAMSVRVTFQIKSKPKENPLRLQDASVMNETQCLPS